MACAPCRVGAQRRRLRRAIGGVAGLAQFIGDQVDAELLPGPNLARRGKNLGRVGKERLLEPLVHNVLVLEVEDS